MRPETDTSVSGRSAGGDDGERVRPDGGGTARPGTTEMSGFDERRADWTPILSAVAVLSGVVAVLGVETSRYAMAAIDAAAAESGTPVLLGVASGSRFGLVTASIAARIVRDLSLVAGGVAIVLGCWVAFAVVVRVAGRS